MSNPTFGTTASGQHVHAHSRHYLDDLLSPKEALKGVKGFNAKLAVLITSGVGTMACAYLFSLIALLSLPEILIQANVLPASVVPHFLNNQGLILIVAWVAQTFIQLVLLSIIMVGQRVQSAAADARAAKQFEDTEYIVGQVNEKTEGGLKAVLDAVGELRADIVAAPGTRVNPLVVQPSRAEPEQEPPSSG